MCVREREREREDGGDDEERNWEWWWNEEKSGDEEKCERRRKMHGLEEKGEELCGEGKLHRVGTETHVGGAERGDG